ncbi:MAG: VanZ family protein [Sandaracinaceae bacterium]|nr:VanZ family protein [Sandaracinaceae bacterium]
MRASWTLALGAYAAVVIAIVAVADLGGAATLFSAVAHVPYGDKLGHFALIGALALLADLAAGRRDARLGRLRVPLASAVVFALVLAEEVSQLAVPARSFDLLDLLADALGVAVFVGAGRVVAARTARAPDAARPSRSP